MRQNMVGCLTWIVVAVVVVGGCDGEREDPALPAISRLTPAELSEPAG